MPLPNPSMDFTALDVLPAAQLDDLVENIEALAAGTGQNSTAVLIQSNPYKFSVYRAAAWTAANNAFGKVAFDTENFDSNNNFDSTTNNRYTAPVAGFYQFNWVANSNVGDGALFQSSLYKNGAASRDGSTGGQGVTTEGASSGSTLIQLAATDYIEIFYYGNGGAGQVGTATRFEGFLVSRT